jgi:hypothetical protein
MWSGCHSRAERCGFSKGVPIALHSPAAPAIPSNLHFFTAMPSKIAKADWMSGSLHPSQVIHNLTILFLFTVGAEVA